MEAVFYAWAQGFWSSMNLASGVAKKPMRELGDEGNQRALRAYCANNPLKDYLDGVLEIYEKLPISH